MKTFWPLVPILAVGVVLLIVLRLGPRLFAGTRLTVRAFWCPFRKRDVAVVFEETVWDAQFVDVSRCNAFSPPTAVACHKNCLRLGDLPVIPERPAPALD